MAKDIEAVAAQGGREYMEKDYLDPPSVPLLDAEELTKYPKYLDPRRDMQEPN